MKYYVKKHKDVINSLNSSTNGLREEKAKELLEKNGLNDISSTKKLSIAKLFFNQLKSVLVIMLIVAAGISITVGIMEGEGILDGIIISAIVVINAVLGVVQEKKASDSLKALQSIAFPKAKVIRNGVVEIISAKEIVVGDIVTLETGDYIPADLRLISSVNLKVDESALTGESVSVEKNFNKVLAEDVPLAERENMVYMSTFVTYGRATGVVTATGFDTEIGVIAKLLNETEEKTTPLQQKINVFGKALTFICGVILLALVGVGLLKGQPFIEVLMMAISLAVAGIPEGLPAVVTVVLAVGMRRMVKKNAIIKHLSAVETLGSTTVICSDKTGTLTQNKMFVTNINDMQKEFSFSGTGYLYDGKIMLQKSETLSESHQKILLAMALCNDSKVIRGKNRIIGDPTEGALRVASKKAGFDYKVLELSNERVKELPFDSERKLMSVLVRDKEDYILLTKGATSELLKRCNKILINGKEEKLTEEHIKKVDKLNKKYAKQALRVLGYAYRSQKSETLKEENLVFVGLSTMIDPPREEVKRAIEKCHRAGIRVVMITGDNKTTASTIGKELGICGDDCISITGTALDKLSDEELKEVGKNTNVFARVSPTNKVQIVNCIKQNGNIVAMTGDGVNDAPALKTADIGISMGITGTDVAKQASDMILTDDNFTSIVSAVEEGRVIYSNIRKFINFLVSCNIGEIFIITIAVFFSGYFNNVLPLLAIQLLWINLITDSLPAFALGLEKAEFDVMNKPPRDPKEPIADKHFLSRVIMQGIGLTIAVLLAFKIGLNNYSVPTAQTMAFVTIVLGELLRAYSARSESSFIFKFNPFSNKFLNFSFIVSLALLMVLVYTPVVNSVFYLTPLKLPVLALCTALALIPMFVAEITKIFAKKD